MSYIFLVVQVLYILLCMTNIQYYNFIILILSDLKKSKTINKLSYYELSFTITSLQKLIV